MAFNNNGRGKVMGVDEIGNNTLRLLVDYLEYNLISISQLCEKCMSFSCLPFLSLLAAIQTQRSLYKIDMLIFTL